MKRLTAVILAILAGTLALASPASAAFGFKALQLSFEGSEGTSILQAGSHPFAMTTTVDLNVTEAEGKQFPDEDLRDLEAELPAGLVGVPAAVPRCSLADFVTVVAHEKPDFTHPGCPDESAVGYVSLPARFLPAPAGPLGSETYALYSLEPGPGMLARFGFVVLGVPVTLDVRLSESWPYRVVVSARSAKQPLYLYGAKVTAWGNPSDPAHDPYRGSCLAGAPQGSLISVGSCPAKPGPPLVSLPTNCADPLRADFRADSWQAPGSFVAGSAVVSDEAEPPAPLLLSDCAALAFSPSISGSPTTKAASSPTGLDFALEVDDPGITDQQGVSASTIRKTEVTLPEGFTTNPSVAEGLEVCTEADVARETAFSEPGAGCPQASKVGTVELETPLLDEKVNGSLFIAKPYENPFGSLLAMYLVIKNPKLGIKVVQPLRVQTDPQTGRITTVAEEMPQLPFSHFRLHFREGARSPLASPPGCGSYDTEATLYPWSGGAPVHSSSTFQIITGPDAGPCPGGGTPPFHPGLLAGTINNAAGSFSPFNVQLSRTDSEQEITHFSIKLPPGVVAKLAGIPFCSDLAIAAAKVREGKPHGGQEELDSPSCPAASEIGRTLVGSGVGPSLAYAPGKVYLAGPYHGSQLSIVAITAAKVGPFDLGSVVVREALRINPETAEVFVDATGSDPIPHIVNGIPVHLRQIKVFVDRPEFALNPTSCEPTSTASTLLGSGTDFGSEADDQPVTVSTRFQAADCGSLGFKPRLQLKLKGKTNRGGNPALTATLRPRPGDANATRVSVALPHSEFLDQGHIRTICTRVQFKAGAGNGAECPAASVYGHAKAWTPLFSEPLEGPIFLRSSEHPLPDLVLALHGLVDVDAVGRIDSVKGGIRNTFDFVPDAPISKVVVSFYGGKKGLLENSTDVCAGKHLATVKMEGHNGRLHNFKAPLKAACPKQKHGKAKRHARAR